MPALYNTPLHFRPQLCIATPFLSAISTDQPARHPIGQHARSLLHSHDEETALNETTTKRPIHRRCSLTPPACPLIMANVQDRGPPSAAAIAIGSAIVAGITGYFLGQASSIGLFGKTDSRAPAARLTQREGVAKPDDAETQSDDDDGEDDDDDSDVQDLGELQTFPGNTEECKLVLVVRSDLGKPKKYPPIFQKHANGLAGMTKGKFSCSYLYVSPWMPKHSSSTFSATFARTC